ncbi:hypothetical protein Tco_0144704 [Tanacetum coccineum]
MEDLNPCALSATITMMESVHPSAPTARNQRHLIPNPKSRNQDTSLVTLGQFAIKLAHQKSYADVRRKPLEFQDGDRVMLKVRLERSSTLWQIGEAKPQICCTFKVIERVGTVAHKLKLPQQLSRVHNTFHVSNLKKCLSDESLVIPLGELRVDDELHFVEEPIEVMDREIKQLKRSRIPIIKVRWNSKRGSAFT